MSRQSYAQHLFRLKLHAGDPIIELAAAWAAGERADAKQIRLAIRSAKQWRESKDKMLRRQMTSVVNRLERYLEYADAVESRKGPKVHGPGTLVGMPARSNPGKNWSRAVTKSRKYHTPPGLFTKSSKAIAAGLLKGAHGDHELAMRRLVFYINRAGRSLPHRTEVLGAKKYLKATVRSNPGRGAYLVHDPFLGDFLEFGSVKTAAKFARDRFGCDPAAECVFVEQDETIVPIGALRSRRNPVLCNPRSRETFENVWADIRQALSHNIKPTARQIALLKKLAAKKGYRVINQLARARGRPLLDYFEVHGKSGRTIRANPVVRFRTCKGKRVSFKARTKRKGKTPKALRPYLFKKGHKARKRC